MTLTKLPSIIALLRRTLLMSMYIHPSVGRAIIHASFWAVMWLAVVVW